VEEAVTLGAEAAAAARLATLAVGSVILPAIAFKDPNATTAQAVVISLAIVLTPRKEPATTVAPKGVYLYQLFVTFF
jgi:hypothetical protein